MKHFRLLLFFLPVLLFAQSCDNDSIKDVPLDEIELDLDFDRVDLAMAETANASNLWESVPANVVSCVAHCATPTNEVEAAHDIRKEWFMPLAACAHSMSACNAMAKML